MTEKVLPQWSARIDAYRPHGFSDLFPVVTHHYRVHESAEKFLGPYNARQRNSSYPYAAPEKDTLKQMIPQGRMNEISYQAYLTSIIRFCEVTKGNRGLPEPHPSTIHSIQLPIGAFEISSKGSDALVSIARVQEPMLVRGLRDASSMKFIIVRPKLSRLGTASGTSWEILFFREPLGYIPDWVDSNMNPRYSGQM